MVALLVGLASEGIAHAAPTAADRETARQLMQDGRDLRDKNDLKGALERFKAADDIMHVPTTGFEVAHTQVLLGRLVEARDTIAHIRLLPQAPDDPNPFKEARIKADQLDASLDGRVPALTVLVRGATPGAALNLWVDGVEVPAAIVGLPRTVDPGHHVVRVKEDDAEATQELDVREGEDKKVELMLTRPTAEPAAVPSQPNPPLGAAPGPSDRPGGSSSSESLEPSPASSVSHKPYALTYAGGAVAGAGLIAGIVTGAVAWSQKSPLESACPGHICPPSSFSAYDSASTMATISTLSFTAAGVGGVVAIISLVVGHRQDPAPSSTAQAAARPTVSPWIGAGTAGLGGSF